MTKNRKAVVLVKNNYNCTEITLTGTSLWDIEDQLNEQALTQAKFLEGDPYSEDVLRTKEKLLGYIECEIIESGGTLR